MEKLCNGGYADFGSYGVLENNLEIEEMWASFQPSIGRGRKKERKKERRKKKKIRMKLMATFYTSCF